MLMTFYLWFWTSFLTICTCKKGEETILLNHLFQDYNKHLRPVHNASSKIVVRLDLAMIKIVNVDLKHETMTSNVQLMQEWTDDFFIWDPHEFNGITRLEIPVELVWVPDIVLVNNVGDLRAHSQQQLPKVLVVHTGQVLWNPKMQLTSLCRMDATYFPFDIQQCFMTFFSWAYSDQKVQITTGRLNKIHFMESYKATAFEVTNSSLQKISWSEYWPSDGFNASSTFTEITFGIELKRKTIYHFYTIIFPSLVISILTVFLFRLSPESGEKIDLGVTILLVFHVMLWSVGEKLPENSTRLPLLAVYLTTIMALTSLSVIMAIIVLNVNNMGPAKDMPHWMHHLLIGKIRPLFNIEVMRPDERKLSNRRKEGQNIRTLLRMHASPRKAALINSISEDKMQHEILHTLKDVALHHSHENDNRLVTLEWRCAAKVIDRMLFWIYLVATVIMTFYILIYIPAVITITPLDVKNEVIACFNYLFVGAIDWSPVMVFKSLSFFILLTLSSDVFAFKKCDEVHACPDNHCCIEDPPNSGKGFCEQLSGEGDDCTLVGGYNPITNMYRSTDQSPARCPCRKNTTCTAEKRKKRHISLDRLIDFGEAGGFDKKRKKRHISLDRLMDLGDEGGFDRKKRHISLDRLMELGDQGGFDKRKKRHISFDRLMELGDEGGFDKRKKRHISLDRLMDFGDEGGFDKKRKKRHISLDRMMDFGEAGGFDKKRKKRHISLDRMMDFGEEGGFDKRKKRHISLDRLMDLGEAGGFDKKRKKRHISLDRLMDFGDAGGFDRKKRHISLDRLMDFGEAGGFDKRKKRHISFDRLIDFGDDDAFGGFARSGGGGDHPEVNGRCVKG